MRNLFIVSIVMMYFGLSSLGRKKKIQELQNRVKSSSKHLQYVLVKGFTSHGGSKTGNQLPHSTVEVVQLG